MEIQEKSESGSDYDESLFTKIDANLKDRARIFITEKKVIKDSKVNSMKDLVEEALHEYMVNHS